MSSLRLIVLTPPGMTDPAIALAACRAGEIGMLDLEYAEGGEDVLGAILKLSRCEEGIRGIKLNGSDDQFLSWLLPRVPEGIRMALLSGTFPERSENLVRILKGRRIDVLREAISVDEARRGAETGADGIVVKGNEAGGRVGEESAFVLLQRVIRESPLPVWVQGGIGIHTAAACHSAGAAGVVLDSQLALSRESSIPQKIKRMISRMDGGETVCLGGDSGAAFRVLNNPVNPVVKELIALERRRDGSVANEGTEDEWERQIRKRIGWSDPVQNVMLLGQDASFAGPLAEKFRTVEGICRGIRESIGFHVRAVRASKPLAKGSALGRSHGTIFPIVQGPMARISDSARFLRRVAEEGALPFFALGLSRGAEAEASLRETYELMESMPWGVGLLGFALPEILNGQLEMIARYRPRFALIAGGNPDQATSLESKGIATYLHVPSPGLLEIFLERGIRRFIFEGRESGGHIGPRTSFVLWENAVDILTNRLSDREVARCHVLFAGGIHDALSASMAAAIGAPIAQKGGKIGIQVGTAYLFTKEAVSTGAIVEGYQKEAIRCTRTTIVESSPGHASRCSITPYVDAFNALKRKLAGEGRSSDEVGRELEEQNLGRLRIASRGIDRNPRNLPEGGGANIVELGPDEQKERGMYMIGQIAALRDCATTVRELHEEISEKGSLRIEALEAEEAAPEADGGEVRDCDVAIIGMSCQFPKANDLNAYWENILGKVDTLEEIPKERWDWRLYYDRDPATRDRVYSKWGGFLEPIPFDPVTYGMTPDALRSIEPVQFLCLEASRAALKDAGYESRDFPRERTSVIFGAGVSMSDMGQNYIVRSHLPDLLAEFSQEALSEKLPKWTSDTFAGILPNVIAGRIANRFNLGGLNFTVDAACASSLAAVYHAVKELANRSSDMVVVGGADTFQSPFAYLCFCKTLALSPSGRCRPFDEDADGTCISEGIGVLVMKRLSDALRDGDRIYSVIKGVGGSSDGRSKGITAPNTDGQVRAIRRALDGAAVRPSTVGLVEAHGTGTPVGDEAEIRSLLEVFGADEGSSQECALGSVKSMIGHTKCAAGVAGLIKASMALYHKVLPPTNGVERPRKILDGGPIYVNTEAKPWVKTSTSPRRAGVSSFGFGGTNFHVIVEESPRSIQGRDREATARTWPCELFLWKGSPREDLIPALSKLCEALDRGARPSLKDLSFTIWEETKKRPSGFRLAIVAGSMEDLQTKIALALEKLRAGEAGPILDRSGLYFTPQPLSGKIAFLFPGQGSQYPGMLRDLAVHFPEIRERFDVAETAVRSRLAKPLSSYVYPATTTGKEKEEEARRNLAQTNVAQPALGAVNMGLHFLMSELGVRPDMTAGHSYGEYAALCAAGVFEEDALYTISEARGRFIREEAGGESGTMSAVNAEHGRVSEIIRGIPDVWIANLNSPSQTVISGTLDGIQAASGKLQAEGISTRPVNVSCAFHSPLVSRACGKLKDLLLSMVFSRPAIDVFSNTTAGIYPGNPEDISSILGDHLIHPVRFQDMIEGMYRSGARIFVETGPRNILTSLARQILGRRPHMALALDVPDRNGRHQLLHALGQLAVHEVPVRLDRLYTGRSARRLDLDGLAEGDGNKYSKTTFLVDGSKAVPRIAPEKKAVRESSVPAVRAADSDKKGPPDSGTASIAKPDGKSRRMPLDFSRRNEDVYRLVQDHNDLMRQFLVTHQTVMNDLIGKTLAPARDTYEGIFPEGTLEELSRSSDGFPGGRGRSPADRPARTECRVDEPGDQVAERSTDRAVTNVEPSAVFEPTSFDFARVRAELVRIVSERTGYPPEALDLNLDLEADLGVDSIKRTEILGMVRRKFPDLAGREGDAAELLKRKTLQGIIDWLGGSGAPALRRTTGEDGPTRVESGGSADIPVDLRVIDKELIRDELVRIASERTGYPPEALELNLDLEADLGIDLIKRIEILGMVQKKYPDLVKREGGSTAEELKKIKTLQGIIDLLAGFRMPPATTGEEDISPSDEDSASSSPETDDKDTKATRYVIKPVLSPLRGMPLKIPEGAVFVIASGNEGLSRAVAGRIRQLGGKTATVRHGETLRETGEGYFAADLSDPDTAGKLVALLRRRFGSISGIIHLPPLVPEKRFDDMDLIDWRESMRINVKGFFYILQAAAADIRRSAASGGGWLVAMAPQAASSSGDVVKKLSPVHGGLAGMLKTIAQEWEDVTCKVITVDTAPESAGTVDRLMDEISDRQGEVEVAYSGTHRFVFRTMPLPLDDASGQRLVMDREWVLLVTGGARGITAEAALEHAERYRPTMVIVGRSPLPEAEEAGELEGISSEIELKKALLDRAGKEGREVKLGEIEIEYRNVLRSREIRNHLKALRTTGAEVRYLQADVRDGESFGGVIERIYEEFGRIDGVIHGAGIIEDRLVEDKHADSFDRVFDTKADSTFILAKKLKAESLKFIAFFSSIAGRFGNRGQCDYAAANDVVNKLANHLDDTWPCRIISAIWGPWSMSGGMASEQVRKQFAVKGIYPFPPEAGRKALHDEIRFGDKENVEIVFGDGPWAYAPALFPLLHPSRISRQDNNTVEFQKTFDLRREIFLQDHRIDDRPVVPFTFVMELMAEAAQWVCRERVATGMHSIQVFKGIILEGDSRDVRVVARPKGTDRNQDNGSVDVEIFDFEKPGRLLYRGVVEMRKRFSEPSGYPERPIGNLHAFPMEPQEAYRRWLFHGPRLENIVSVGGINNEVITGVIKPSSADICLAGWRSDAWLMDPVVLDCAFQLMLLWTRSNYDMTGLPTRVASFHWYGAFPGKPLTCRIHVRPSEGGEVSVADIYLIDHLGRLAARFDKAEFFVSRDLNRFCGKAGTYAESRA